MVRFELVPGVSADLNDDGGILVDPNTGSVYVLSEVAARIVAILRDSVAGRTFDSLLRSLMLSFDVDEEQLRRDVWEYLMDLESRGLARRLDDWD